MSNETAKRKPGRPPGSKSRKGTSKAGGFSRFRGLSPEDAAAKRSEIARMGAQAQQRKRAERMMKALNADRDAFDKRVEQAVKDLDINTGQNPPEIQKLIKLLIQGVDADEALAESGANLSIGDLQKIKQMQATEARRQSSIQEMHLRSEKYFTAALVEQAFDYWADKIFRAMDRIAATFKATTRLNAKQAKEEGDRIQKMVEDCKAELITKQEEVLSNAARRDDAGIPSTDQRDSAQEPASAAAETGRPESA